MNQIFCFRRYLWLVKRQWYENAVIYKWGIALMALATGLLFWLSGNWKAVENPALFQEPILAIVGFLFFYIYAAWFFDSISAKNKKMFYFSLPVMPLERVATAFTFVIIFMPVIILAIFVAVDFIAVQLFNQIHETSVQPLFKTLAPAISVGVILKHIFTFLSIASVFTLGSLMFGKKGPVVSFTFLIVFQIVFYYAIVLIKRLLFAFGEVTEHQIQTFLISERGIFVYLMPIWWILMYVVMKKKEA